ncbi:heterokaryon incompatibility protein-domain-containing protein [Hypoxylon sp. NC1633]|nr:heterokaryon incompatibility protein-domain-containing protein [Hypoxylon sp. NC1633]
MALFDNNSRQPNLEDDFDSEVENSDPEDSDVDVIQLLGFNVSSLAEMESWYQEYTTVDGDNIYYSIGCVDDDELEYDEMERKVQQLMPTSRVLEGFCAQCRHLLGHWPELSTDFWTPALGRSCRTVEIEAATRSGCRFCSFLFARLLRFSLLDTFRKIENRLNFLNSGQTASLMIARTYPDNNTLWLNLPGRMNDRCDFYIPQYLSIESWALSPTDNLWRKSLEQFDLIRAWIDKCCTSHRGCHSAENVLPTRLIYIGNGTLKLILTATLTSPLKYATLSYAWGRKPFTMLTTETLEQFQTGISLDDLPKTMRDAIFIAGKLDIQYLWIDALCIIQNQENKSDWLKESCRMGSVYGGSYVNIAASSARGVDVGCFTKQKYWSGGFCARTTAAEYSMVRGFCAWELYDEYTSFEYLASRAWTFQEKLLSPRTIYFGDKGLFWECRSNTMSEFVPDGLNQIFSRPLLCPQGEAYDWDGIADYYSNTNLTFVSDRLPALSGVARRQHEVTKDSYLAGMWKNDLVDQLLWTLWSPKNRTQRLELSIPTWSWASVGSRTTTFAYIRDKPTRYYAHVLDAKTLHISDPFGAVTGGELLMACPFLVPGRLGHKVRDESTSDSNANVFLRAGMRPFPITQDCKESTISADDTIFMLPIVDDSYPNSQGSSETTPANEDERESFSITGIVIRRCGNDRGRFHRIGHFSFDFYSPPYSYDPEPGRYHEFMRILNEVGASTGETECMEVLSDPPIPEARYVIMLK